MVRLGVGLGNGHANLRSMDSGSVKSGEQFVGVLGMGKDEKAAGGLRIEENILNVGGDRIRNVTGFGEKVAIARQTTRTKTRAAVFQRAWQDWNFSMIELNGNVTGFCDFAGVADEAEAGDVRHRINSELEADFRGTAIELEHHIDGGLNVFG